MFNEIFGVDIDIAKNRNYDFIVIGCGMYGSLAASLLYNKSLPKPKILIIEAGPWVISDHFQNTSGGSFEMFRGVTSFPFVSEVQSSKGAILDSVAPDYNCVGGKSLLWGKWAPRLSDETLNRWPKLLQEKLRHYYPIAESELNISEGKEWAISGIPEKVIERLNSFKVSGLGNFEAAPLAVDATKKLAGVLPRGVYTSLSSLIEVVARSRKTNEGCVDILSEADVKKLEKVGSNVVSVSVIHKGKDVSFKINSRTHLILAPGTLNSTKIAHTLFPENNLIGREIHTHIRSNLEYLIPRSSLKIYGKMASNFAMMQRGKYGGRDFHVQWIFGAYDEDDSEFGWFRKDAYHNAILENDRVNKDEYFSVRVNLIGEKPGSGSKVLFGSEKERPLVKWLLTDEDMALWDFMEYRVIEMVKLLSGGKEILRTNNISDDNIPSSTEAFRDTLSSSYHEVGTMLMDESPLRGVLNLQGRFHDLKNLWCVDQSIFASAGSANPVLTGVALCYSCVDELINNCGISREEANKSGFSVSLLT